MSNYLKELAKKVGHFIASKNLSAREFAELCGISNSSVSAFLKNPSQSDLRFSTIESMSNAIGLSPLEALSSAETPRQSPIEARLSALESRVFSTPSNSGPEDEFPEIDAVVAEVDEEFAPQPKKSGRKTGSE